MKSSIVAAITLGVWFTLLFSSVKAGLLWREEAAEVFKIWAKAPDRETYQKLLLNRMLTTMDMSYDPCDDFYNFACKNYDLVTPKNYVGDQMSPIDETVIPQAPIMEQFIKTESDAKTSADERKMREFYKACLNGQNSTIKEEAILQGFQSWPVHDQNWSESGFDWTKAAAQVEMFGVPVLFAPTIEYGNNDQNEAELLALNFNVTEYFVLVGEESLEADVEMLTEVLATFQLKPSEIEDIARGIHEIKVQLRLIGEKALKTVNTERISTPILELQKRVPSCDLQRLVSSYAGREVDVNTHLIVPSEQYLEDVCKLFGETDKRAVANFMWLYLLIGVFQERETYNQKTPEDLDTYCVGKTQRLFKPVVMKLYRKEYLPEVDRSEFVRFAANLKEVGNDLIASSTTWLDETTRQRALKKMEAVKIVVSHPESEGESWKSYSDIEIDPTDYIGNLRRLTVKNYYDDKGVHGESRVFHPRDPYAVSPVFFPRGKGVLYFPAISLQPPIYHSFTPSFQKYGALGTTVGHELMHNFDVDGIEYDEHGQKAKWLSNNIEALYASRTQCFLSQFNAYKLNGTDIHVQGDTTLAENVADADGLKIGFEAYKRWMARNPQQILEEQMMFAPLQMNHEKAFFISFAQMWCDSRSLEGLKEQIETDAHAPAMFRIPGALSNFPEFSNTFNCPASSKMSPPKKCSYILD